MTDARPPADRQPAPDAAEPPKPSPPRPTAPARALDRRTLLALALIGAAILLALVLEDRAARALVVVALAAALWSTALAPEAFTALLFFVLALLLDLAPPPVVFSGFASSAIWLIFAGLILALAVRETGLGARLVRRIAARLSGPRALIWASGIMGAALAFAIPSAMARIFILTPLIAAAADRMGLAEDDPDRLAAGLAGVFCASLPAGAILPAAVPNLVLMGAAETLHGVRFSYAAYLALFAPVLGLGVFGLLLGGCLRWAARQPRRARGTASPQSAAPRNAAPEAPAPASLGPITAPERRLALILGATLLLWTTDALHGLSPAWVGLAAAVAVLSPGLGVLGVDAIGRVDFRPWLFVAGVIGVGAVAEAAGLARLLADAVAMDAALREWPGPLRFLALTATAAVAALLVTLPAAPSILTPLGPDWAAATGWSLEAVLLTQIPAYMLALFPYQVPPLLVGGALIGAPPRLVARLLWRASILGWVFLLPTHYIWAFSLGFYP